MSDFDKIMMLARLDAQLGACHNCDLKRWWQMERRFHRRMGYQAK